MAHVHSAIVPPLSMVAFVKVSVTIMHATGMALTVLWVFHHGSSVKKAKNVGKSLRIRNVIENATMPIAISTIMIAMETPQLSAQIINATNSTTTVSVMISVTAKHVLTII